MEFAIEVKNLKKYFSSGIRSVVIQALDDVSFNVSKGKIFGLLGSNGAGKSTAIKIIMGLLKPNSGEVRIFGEKISNSIKAKIGYLPESPNFYRYLSSYELVLFYAKICGMRNDEAELSTIKALKEVGLEDAMHRRLSEYSKGMLQRAGLAQAIVHNPDIVILDEPSSGLDPIGMSDMTEMIRKLKYNGKTILLCSHQLSEVEALCDDIIIMNNGKIFSEGNLDNILRKDGSISVDISGISKELLEEVILRAGGNIDKLSDTKISLEEYFNIAVRGDLR